MKIWKRNVLFCFVFTFPQLFAVHQQRERRLRVTLRAYWRLAVSVSVMAHDLGSHWCKKNESKEDAKTWTPLVGTGNQTAGVRWCLLCNEAGGIFPCGRFPGDGEID